jgi:hypothetical protein
MNKYKYSKVEMTKMFRDAGYAPYRIARLPELKDDYAVGASWYRRWVEIMSYPFEEGGSWWIMARTTPGDATTLVKIECINDSGYPSFEIQRPTKRWVHYAEISGVGQFPDDMFRYDMCQFDDYSLNPFRVGEEVLNPKTGASYGIYRVKRPSEGAESPKFIIVQVSNESKPRWTEGRWRSFLWSIKPMHTQFIPGTDVEPVVPAVAYHVSGWSPVIKSRERRASNRSDGAVFSTKELADAYVRDTDLKGAKVEKIDNPTAGTVDHLIHSGTWKPVNVAPKGATMDADCCGPTGDHAAANHR